MSASLFFILGEDCFSSLLGVSRNVDFLELVNAERMDFLFSDLSLIFKEPNMDWSLPHFQHLLSNVTERRSVSHFVCGLVLRPNMN